jgi:NAD(P)-dependent dehydrogenase (short-subunit alcohol dehydrogenase family)
MTTVLITGGHAGLGWAAASTLASGEHADIVLAGRDLERVAAAAQRLREQYEIEVTPLRVDLSSLDSVRAAAAQVRGMIADGTLAPFQALICNAGAQFLGPVSYSADGYEETFAINHLGHFLLVDLLLDCVADGGRVVFTASGTHDPDTIDGKLAGAAVEPDAVALANEGKNGKQPISGGKRYATSKLCTILFSYELDRRLKRAHQPLSSIAFEPGWIPETGLIRTAPFAQWLSRTALAKWIVKTIGVPIGSLPFSGAALASLALDKRFATASGKYFQSRNGTLIEARSSKTSYDEKKAASLWEDSERLVRLTGSERSNRLQFPLVSESSTRQSLSSTREAIAR